MGRIMDLLTKQGISSKIVALCDEKHHITEDIGRETGQVPAETLVFKLALSLEAPEFQFSTVKHSAAL